MFPSIMSPTAVRVTEPPAADFRGSAAGLGPVATVARALAGLAEVDESAADVTTVLPGEPPMEQAETTSATAGAMIARSPLRRMRPNLARDGPACGDVEPDGGSDMSDRMAPYGDLP